MTKTATEFAIRRILVALDPSMPCRAALEAATELAAALKADLEALLVEDINLLRLAEFPNAQELRYLLASREPLDSASLRRGLRVQNKRARKLMAATAQRARVTYSLREVRGHVTQELLAAASQSDLLVLGRAGRTRSRQVRVGSTALAVAQQAQPSVLVLQCGSLANRPLWAVYDGSPSSLKTLNAAAQLSRCSDPCLKVVIAAEDPSQHGQLAQEATDLLRELDLEADYLFLKKPNIETLVHQLRSDTEAVLLVGIDSLPIREEPIQRLLDDVDNPVFLVR